MVSISRSSHSAPSSCPPSKLWKHIQRGEDLAFHRTPVNTLRQEWSLLTALERTSLHEEADWAEWQCSNELRVAWGHSTLCTVTLVCPTVGVKRPKY
jgi:hypothetical protein